MTRAFASFDEHHIFFMHTKASEFFICIYTIKITTLNINTAKRLSIEKLLILNEELE